MTGTPEAAPALDPWIGRVLDGRYRVTGVIGAGGMGTVYRVEHVAMGKVMAVKVLSPRIGASEDGAARFQREAFVGGRIGHPNCVAVSDFGTLEDGSFYLVMELLVGESLGDVLDREGRLPWRRALAIARHILRGLGHAHDHGVVHRDIKPDNVFLARHDDDPEFAKILDFGIAKLVGDGGTTITQAGITVGTPAYLSPEQAFGGELDGRSDLYSLSIVLFEMLTGATPFADRDLVAMLTAHAVAEIPAMPPDAQVPPPVEALVRDGLAKSPGDRIGSAAEYVARIDDLLGRAASVAPVSNQTPQPFPAPLPSVGTPMPGTISALHTIDLPNRTLTMRIRALPTWQKVALGTAGAILAVGAIAAIASTGDSSDERPRAAAVATVVDAGAAAKPTPTPPTKPPATAPDAGPSAPPPAPPLDPATEARFQAALTTLQKARTCGARKAAIDDLVAIGDPRAIAPLKKARVRMRGGLLGIGASNSNSCLKAAAEDAIKRLGGTL